MNYETRRDNHDFMTPEHVATFLRNHNTGVNNLGRHRLASLVRSYKNPSVLDVACGTCVNWEVFKNVSVDCQYIGLDRTEKMLAHAKNLYKDEIVLKQGYIQSIPFEDSSIDVVIARHILEHLGDGYHKAIREVFRVAREEAILVFFVDLAEGDEDVIKESEPDDNGCTYFWNTYSNSKLMEFLSEFNCQIKVEYCITPGAAAADTIVRLIK